VPVASLTGDVDGPADVAVTLVARQERFRLATGEEVDGYTLNGTSPGPTLHVPQGKLLEVRLVNESVTGGTTLHWHGVAVPNADDGVAGVTQDAVPAGGSHVYRFRPSRAGTYWYHAHQLSHEQVERGLLGALVVDPPDTTVDEATEVVALTHLYAGRRTVAGRSGDVPVPAEPGRPVRIRVINTDNGPMILCETWAATLRYSPSTARTSTSPPRQRYGGRRDRRRPVDLEVVPPTTGAVRVTIGGRRRWSSGRPVLRRRRRRGNRRPWWTCCTTAHRRRSGSTRRPRPAASPTPSAAAPASSTAVPGCGGR
jgi:hypothetical protein